LGVYRPPLLPYPLLPTRPALVYGIEREEDLRGALRGLLLRYPPAHSATLVAADGTLEALALDQIEPANLHAAPSVGAFGGRGGLALQGMFVPPLLQRADLRGADGPAWVAARLLAPGGCPWDVRQTHQSLRAGLLEETYEVLEALDSGDIDALAEELGDLLLQTFVHAEMARQEGHFDVGDVYAHLAGKLINRHPHVFGALDVEGQGEVLRNWEAIKGRELAAKGRERRGALDGVPAGLPALAAAQKLLKKAAREGFDWPDLQAVWGKLQEELAELQLELETRDPQRVADELGDVLFCLSNLARWLDVEAEGALRATSLKFRRRFDAVEQGARAQGRALNELNLGELLALWEQAKGDKPG
jgi:tetrapyrrole methylase family protein/MazG family protein